MDTDNSSDLSSLRRQQTTTIRVEKKTLERIKDYQARLGKDAPTLTALIDFCWENYERRQWRYLDHRFVRLEPEERYLVRDLVYFLGGKLSRKERLSFVAIIEELLAIYQTKSVQLSLDMPQEAVDRLNAEAARRGISTDALLNELILTKLPEE